MDSKNFNETVGESDHFLKWLQDFVHLRWPTGITYAFRKTLWVGKISLSSVFTDFYDLWSKEGASIANCWVASRLKADMELRYL